jgi:hypothetical protein
MVRKKIPHSQDIGWFFAIYETILSQFKTAEEEIKTSHNKEN